MNPTLNDVRQRVYEDEYVAITQWDVRKGEERQYQITAKDDAMKRSGNGYLILPAKAMQAMCYALGNIAWLAILVILSACEESASRHQMYQAVDSTGLAKWHDSTNGATCYASRVYGGMAISCIK